MTSTGFDDSTVAARTRDAMRRLMVRTIDSERPPYSYGTVKQIDPDLKSCKVWLPGNGSEADPANWITVKIGGIVPASIGQVVRISGRLGDKFVSDVMGAARMADHDPADIPAPANFDLVAGIGLVSGNWEPVEEATRYRFQLADDVGFTVNVRQYDTIGTGVILGNQNPGAVLYGRVAGLTNTGVGPWSNVDSATVMDYPQTDLSDGDPPASSPQPTVTAGIGFLLAEWLAVPNGGDQVTYEVHVSDVSGFTPDATTLLGEITGTFYFVSALADGTPLAYGTQYYVRLIAKDRDGAAPVGAQGAGTPRKVDTGDVGHIAVDELSDGNIPANSPTAAPTVTSGIGYLYVQWVHISNPDAVTYEMHISDVSGFTPDANTYVGETPSNFGFIRRQGPGAFDVPLVYGTTYYIKIWAKDADGYALTASPEATGNALKAGTVDISEGTITAESAILADLAVGSAKIADLAVSSAKIADLAVSSAKIQDLAVGTAKIADAAIATAKIGDLAVTSAKISSLAADKITAGTITSQAIYLNGAAALIGSTGGTWYVRGDGYAYFGNVTVQGTVQSSTITGSIFQTATSGARIVIDQTQLERIKFFDSGGTQVGHIGWKSSGYGSGMTLAADSGSVNVVGPDGSIGSGSFKVYNFTCNNATSETFHAYTGYSTDGYIQRGGQNVVTHNELGSASVSFANSAGSAPANGGTATHLSGGSVVAGSGYNHTFASPSNRGGGVFHYSLSYLYATSGGANNLTWDSSNGRVYYAASTSRIKTDILDVTETSKVLQLQPRSWTPNIPEEELSSNDRFKVNNGVPFIGFVAEEVAAIDPAFAILDADGQPIAIEWQAVTAMLVEETKRLRSEMDSILPPRPNV